MGIKTNKKTIIVKRGPHGKEQQTKVSILKVLSVIGVGTIQSIQRTQIQLNYPTFAQGTIKKYMDLLVEKGNVKIFKPVGVGYAIYYVGKTFKAACSKHAKYLKKTGKA